MKKIITIATLTALALALMMTGAWASDISGVPEHEHYAICKNPGVCAACGLEDATLVKEHNIILIPASDNTHYYYCIVCDTAQSEEEPHTAVSYTYTDEYGHSMKCAVCGSWQYSHRTDCLHPGKCIDCGGAYEVEVKHTYKSSEYTTDADGHWNVCTVCNEKQNYEAHNWKDGFNYTNHWKQCTKCGTKNESPHSYEQKKYYIFQYSHGLICDNCEYQNHASDESHTSSGAWLHNETEHYRNCDVCGVDYGHTAHKVHCQTPGVCYTCGRAITLEAQHDSRWTEWDNTYHVQVCIICFQVTSEKEPHVIVSYTSSDIKKHHVECSVCGGWSENHRYTDDTSNVCLDCGFDRSSYPHEHVYTRKQYGSDGTNHWLICDTCGKASTEVTAHSGDARYNDTEHWYWCSVCRTEYGHSAHTYDQNRYYTTDYSHVRVCDVCDMWNGSYESHTATGTWLHNETEHYRTCSVCGVNYDNETHDVRCTMPGVCHTCGTQTALEARHDMHYWSVNNFYHQYRCDNCDGVTSEIEACTYSDYTSLNIRQHKAWCDVCGLNSILNHRYDINNPTTCLDCGFEKTASDASHEHSYNQYTFARDDNNHWQICTICSFPNSESVTAHVWSVRENESTATCTKAGTVVYWCRCDLYKTENGTLDHDWKETDRSAPTCTDAGSVTKVCRRCDETETEEIPALNHDWQEAHNIASTCVSKGYIMQVCMNCSETTLEEIDALGHDWYEAERKEPTATEKGYIIMACHNCDETTTEEIPTGADHDWYESERKEPTCTEKGYVITACHHCDETTTQEIPAQGHNWYEAERVEATDAAAGYILFACYNCDETSTEEIPALAHEWYEAERVEATCSEAGYILIACKHCDKTQTQELPKLDHQWGKPEIISATCTEEGSEKMTCTVCGVFTRIRFAPLGHSFPEDSPVCSVCGYNNASAVSPDGTEQTKTMEEIVAAFQAETPQAQIMHVSLNLGDLPLQLSGTIQITIPLEGTGWESFRLVQLHEDETITDVPYEIIDGKLVFEVDILGYFALIPA